MPSGRVHEGRTKAAKSSPLPLPSSRFAPPERGWGAPRETSAPLSPLSPAENIAAWRAWAKADPAPFGFTVSPVSSPRADHRAPPLRLQAKLEVGAVDDPL